MCEKCSIGFGIMIMVKAVRPFRPDRESRPDRVLSGEIIRRNHPEKFRSFIRIVND